MSMFFSENLRLLRKQRKLTQQKLADELIITRARLAKYEEAKSEPPLEILKRIANFFHVSIDILISVNLHKVPLAHLLKMDSNRILLPIIIDRDDQDQIEIVPDKARAGYLSGFCDPEYIEQLSSMNLPFLGPGKHRAFRISGDSMLPTPDGAMIVGRFVERRTDITDGRSYIVLSNDGIVYKRVNWKNKKKKIVTLSSDNPAYSPYELELSEVLELWEFVCMLQDEDKKPEEVNMDQLLSYLQRIEKRLEKTA